MARSYSEIYDQMVAEKQSAATLNELQPNIDSSQQLLTDLTNPAKVGVWRVIFSTIAWHIFVVESLFDLHKQWINNRAIEIQTGTLPWYRDLALRFQFGDSLLFINGVYKYLAINPSIQIVKLATCNESGGNIILKVAKFDSAGDPEELSAPELTSLQDYIKKMKFAGAKVSVVSRPPDLIKVHYKVYYDPLVLSPTGEMLSLPGVYPVRSAINTYCKSLPFDGVYSKTAQTDLIQQALGVVDPVHQSTEVKYGANPYTTFDDYYQPNAGYLIVDPAYPLSATITYIPAQ
jgi:hypothetical protein